MTHSKIQLRDLENGLPEMQDSSAISSTSSGAALVASCVKQNETTSKFLINSLDHLIFSFYRDIQLTTWFSGVSPIVSLYKNLKKALSKLYRPAITSTIRERL